MKIYEMAPQQEGVIDKIENTNLPCVQRLMTFGLVEGSTVKYIGSVVGGSPLEVELYGSKLAVRRDCSSHFNVRT